MKHAEDNTKMGKQNVIKEQSRFWFLADLRLYLCRFQFSQNLWSMLQTWMCHNFKVCLQPKLAPRNFRVTQIAENLDKQHIYISEAAAVRVSICFQAKEQTIPICSIYELIWIISQIKLIFKKQFINTKRGSKQFFWSSYKLDVKIFKRELAWPIT